MQVLRAAAAAGHRAAVRGLAEHAGERGDTPLLPGTATFTAPGSLDDNAFGLAGTWTVTDESITAKKDAVITLTGPGWAPSRRRCPPA